MNRPSAALLVGMAQDQSRPDGPDNIAFPSILLTGIGLQSPWGLAGLLGLLAWDIRLTYQILPPVVVKIHKVPVNIPRNPRA